VADDVVLFGVPSFPLDFAFSLSNSKPFLFWFSSSSSTTSWLSDPVPSFVARTLAKTGFSSLIVMSKDNCGMKAGQNSNAAFHNTLPGLCQCIVKRLAKHFAVRCPL
jgi:hypothetical protein